MIKNEHGGGVVQITEPEDFLQVAATQPVMVSLGPN